MPAPIEVNQDPDARRAFFARIGRMGALARLRLPQYRDRRILTHAANTTRRTSFEKEVDPDHQLSEQERARRVKKLERIHMTQLSLRAVEARRRAQRVVNRGKKR